jgi:hypothetical protein
MKSLMIDFTQWINLIIVIEIIGVILLVSQLIDKVTFLKNKKILIIGFVLLGGGLGVKLILYLVTWMNL